MSPPRLDEDEWGRLMRRLAELEAGKESVASHEHRISGLEAQISGLSQNVTRILNNQESMLVTLKTLGVGGRIIMWLGAGVITSWGFFGHARDALAQWWETFR